VKRSGTVRLEAEDRTAVPGRTSVDETGQYLSELLARADTLEQIPQHRGLPFGIPGERLRLEIGRAGESVGDRPEHEQARPILADPAAVALTPDGPAVCLDRAYVLQDACRRDDAPAGLDTAARPTPRDTDILEARDPCRASAAGT
jgi:hypothetical protein